MRRLLVLATSLVLVATPVLAYRITSYHTAMAVQRDSSVLVTETITADFNDGVSHHGIYRDLALSGSDNWGNRYRIRLDGLDVRDPSRTPQTTKVTMLSGNLHVRIGDPDSYVEGLRTYVISYRLQRAVHYFKDHDELYWNVVGDKWVVPVEDAACTVTLPGEAGNALRAAAYTGSYGSQSSEAAVSTPDAHTAAFQMNRPLNSGEGMTVVVGWPKGILQPPSFSQAALWFVSDNGYFFLPIIFLLFLLLLWNAAGRDPDTGKSEAVMYDPPDKLSAAEVGTLIDEKVDIRDISASIIDLAVRGYIHIKAEVIQGLLFGKTDYELTLLKPIEEIDKDPNVSDYDRKLLNAIFGGASTKMMSDLKYNFYAYLPALKDALYDSLVDHSYFARRPDSIRAEYLGAGIFFAVAGVGLAIFLLSGAVAAVVPAGWGAAIALCGLMLMAASWVMPRKTGKGKDALLGAKGFEEYLARAESQQIKMQEREGYFEKFLPYAMAFGIADKWAKAFDGIQTAPPNWYAGSGVAFRPSLFAFDMMAMSHSWGQTMTSTPRSSGSGGFFSGGSGFGGGFSGGGGGGGGGGGW